MKKDISDKNLSKKKKTPWGQYLIMLFFLAIGALCGALAASLDGISGENSSFSDFLLSLAAVLIGLYAAIFLQTVIHEAGHLVFGLLTGYRFSSFRTGSFMLISENGKLKLRRLSIAGTGGQCLMSPPDIKDGKMPYVLYNLGGSVLNAVVSALCFLLYILLPEIPFLSVFLIFLSVTGIAFALINGIPLHAGSVDNDGYNVLSLGKSEKALRAFWVQMKMNENISKGVRIKDMPDEWFALPEKEDMQNNMTAAIAVFRANKLLDSGDLEGAKALIEDLLSCESAILDIHKNLMKCDLLTINALTCCATGDISKLLDKPLKKFMKTMKSFPSVLRTQYVLALLYDNNRDFAKQFKERFEKRALTYPYPSDLLGERELMALAEAKASDTV